MVHSFLVTQLVADQAIVFDEFPVVSSQAQKTPKLLHSLGCWPLSYYLDLGTISSHPLLRDHMPQVFNRLPCKGAFGLLDQELMLF